MMMDLTDTENKTDGRTISMDKYTVDGLYGIVSKARATIVMFYDPLVCWWCLFSILMDFFGG